MKIKQSKHHFLHRLMQLYIHIKYHGIFITHNSLEFVTLKHSRLLNSMSSLAYRTVATNIAFLVLSIDFISRFLICIFKFFLANQGDFYLLFRGS